MTLQERNAKLAEAKALVLKGWCQGAYGMTAEGKEIMNGTEEELMAAVCFCATGAVAKVSWYEEEDAQMNAALNAAIQRLGFNQTIVQYNDTEGRTKYEVAAIFDHAMEEPL